MSSDSVLTFFPAGNCLTTNSLLQLSPLLLFNCRLADRAENTILLLLFAGRCPVTPLYSRLPRGRRLATGLHATTCPTRK
jgi:hypothetical protein